MIRIRSCGVLLCGLLAVTAGGAASAPTAEAEHGRAIYTAKGCYQCHGLAAQGAMGVGPALAPPSFGLEAFSAYVRGPAGQMPPYSATLLPKAELEDIFAYLRSLAPSPRAAGIPILAPYVAGASGTHTPPK